MYPSVINLSSLLSANGGDGSIGFVINGIEAGDRSGGSVSSAGDINGDGFDDIIIGASNADANGNGNGESYVIFGQAGGFGTSLELSTLDGTNGFVINGVEVNDRSGSSVSSAGDINGDGFDDILIGASGADTNGDDSGASYVVFGKEGGFSASLELSSLNGTNGFVINGVGIDDISGSSVSSAGDINGDGFDDILIGAVGQRSGPYSYDASSGKSYIVFGRADGFGASLELSSLDGTNGFVINGVDASDYSGFSVSSAGDINGDGFDDILIGAFLSDPNGDASGESYVVFGQADGFEASLELSSLDGTNGFVINGIDARDYSGASVSSAGDINGDGFDDILIGADQADFNGNNSNGASYVVFGRPSGFSASLELSSLNGTNGFVINGIDEYDNSGRSVSSAGDINGDGFDDLIIGATGTDVNGIDSGTSYVVFGRASGFSASLELSSLDGINGFAINGIDSSDGSGRSVSSAGDINGDGFDDILIGAAFADPNGIASGESYVIYGRADFGRTEFLTAGDDVYTGTNNDDFVRGLAGDDIINGGAGRDTIDANSGNDTLYGDTARALSTDGLEGQLFRAFQAVFDRAPDAGGFNAFLTEMRLGNTTQEAVIAEFVTSAEFQNTFGALDNQGFVEQLFRNVLDREGDAGGIAAFTAALDGGRERASVVTEFANSAEFVQLMTVPSAAFATNVIINPAEAQVFRIFQAVFLRDPDEGGFTVFTNSIQAGVLTAEAVTAEFVDSTEFQQTYGDLDNAAFVELLFTNVLPGNTDVQGRANFTDALDAGTLTRAGIVAEFVNSFEFVQRMSAPAEAFVASTFTSSGDVLDGGAGNDILFGGRGADSFVFDTEAGGIDIILDFTSGTDTLDLGANADFDSFGEIMAAGTQAGLDTVFDFGNGNTLTLENVTLSELTEADFGLLIMG